MGVAEIAAFLSWLAERRQVSASTQNQALQALLFLYREVVGADPGIVSGIVRAKRSDTLPVVLSRNEVRTVLAQLRKQARLIVLLLYGAGLRLRECLRSTAPSHKNVAVRCLGWTM
jgi:integrase